MQGVGVPSMLSPATHGLFKFLIPEQPEIINSTKKNPNKILIIFTL